MTKPDSLDSPLYDQAISGLADGIKEAFSTTNSLVKSKGIVLDSIKIENLVKEWLGPAIRHRLENAGLSQYEEEVIAKVRKIGYGEVTAKIQAGRIVLIEEKRTTKVQG